MISWNAKTVGNSANPAILFLHGFMGSLEDWHVISKQLSTDYFCVMIDLPGHGNTVVSQEDDFRMSKTAGSLIGYLKSAGIQNCHLLGYSMGGRLALYIAVNFPQECNRVVLESANPGLIDEKEKKVRRKYDEELAREIEKNSAEEFLDKWYSMPLFQTLKEHPGFKELLENRIRYYNKDLSKSLVGMGLGNQASFWNKLNQLKMPILILTGEKDEKFRKIALQMYRKNKGFRVSVVRDCGHNVHFEDPETFVWEVKKFLKSEEDK
jgi:2-succinyl-6-hydroxy-2,4-cyclohexadiene-1-carboxylate synthase